MYNMDHVGCYFAVVAFILYSNAVKYVFCHFIYWLVNVCDAAYCFAYCFVRDLVK